MTTQTAYIYNSPEAIKGRIKSINQAIRGTRLRIKEFKTQGRDHVALVGYLKSLNKDLRNNKEMAS
tara:strand:- start:255 stop:452 length:198 start_codon:yes stop_codon:yes gene_type:complete